MAARKKTPLSRLFRNFVLGMFMAVICSWLFLSLRLEYVQDVLSLRQRGALLLFLEYFLLAGAFFGLIIALLALPALMARIGRIAALGEDKW